MTDNDNEVKKAIDDFSECAGCYKTYKNRKMSRANGYDFCLTSPECHRAYREEKFRENLIRVFTNIADR